MIHLIERSDPNAHSGRNRSGIIWSFSGLLSCKLDSMDPDVRSVKSVDHRWDQKSIQRNKFEAMYTVKWVCLCYVEVTMLPSPPLPKKDKKNWVGGV